MHFAFATAAAASHYHVIFAFAAYATVLSLPLIYCHAAIDTEYHVSAANSYNNIGHATTDKCHE